MNKATVKPMREIRYTSLPSTADMSGKLKDDELFRYGMALARAHEAHCAAAAIACKGLRPAEYRAHQDEYMAKVREAKRTRNEALLGVFSEVCHRGLDLE